MVIYQAHKGVSSDYPENTMRAYRAAVREGYGIIECDPKYTKDGVIVLLHDRTVNRTGRNPDGSAIAEETKIADLTLAEAEKLDFGVWKAPEFAGEKLPTLAELLAFAEESGIRLKIDNVWESFPPEMRDAMLKQLGNSHANIGVTCKTPEDLRLVAETLPRAELHYDGGDLSAERIRARTGADRLGLLRQRQDRVVQGNKSRPRGLRAGQGFRAARNLDSFQARGSGESNPRFRRGRHRNQRGAETERCNRKAVRKP